jgi:ATP-dependent DNA ligase
MLAKSFDDVKTDPTGWLMSEKLDGVRCFWN